MLHRLLTVRASLVLYLCPFAVLTGEINILKGILKKIEAKPELLNTEQLSFLKSYLLKVIQAGKSIFDMKSGSSSSSSSKVCDKTRCIHVRFRSVRFQTKSFIVRVLL